MLTPAWILDGFAALVLVVAAVSAVRLAVARPWRGGLAAADADVAHLLMAIAMAGALAASLTTLPDTVWEVVFGLMTAWFAWRVLRDSRARGVRALAGGHRAPHLVHSGSMLYMLLALAVPASGGAGMGAMAGAGGSSGLAMQALRYPALAFAFALILAAYSVWDLDQLSVRCRGMAGAAMPLALAGCRVVMGVTMAFMLVIMI